MMKSLLIKISLIFLFANVSLAQKVPLYNTDSKDSRIKTFVYSENEIYRIVLYQGFQSNIEFAMGETVQTISLGESTGWKISPVDRRLFIKPLEENIHTNMTIITNRRTYHFEILAKAPEDIVDPEFAYVVRFFYPSED